MSRREWRVTGTEFGVALRSAGLDRLPYPLRYRENADTGTQLRTQRSAAAARLAEDRNDDLRAALEVFARPSLRIELYGFLGPNLQTIVRVHAALLGPTAVVAVQDPGATPDTGSDLVVRRLPAKAITSQLLELLPSCAPGRLRELTIHKSDLDDDRRGGILTATDHVGPHDTIATFFDRPRTLVAEFGAAPGGGYDNRTDEVSTSFHVIDYANDGRYLVRNRPDSIVAQPATSTAVAAAVDSLISRTEWRSGAE